MLSLSRPSWREYLRRIRPSEQIVHWTIHWAPSYISLSPSCALTSRFVPGGIVTYFFCLLSISALSKRRTFVFSCYILCATLLERVVDTLLSSYNYTNGKTKENNLGTKRLYTSCALANPHVLSVSFNSPQLLSLLVDSRLVCWAYLDHVQCLHYFSMFPKTSLLVTYNSVARQLDVVW